MFETWLYYEDMNALVDGDRGFRTVLSDSKKREESIRFRFSSVRVRFSVSFERQGGWDCKSEERREKKRSDCRVGWDRRCRYVQCESGEGRRKERGDGIGCLEHEDDGKGSNEGGDTGADGRGGRGGRSSRSGSGRSSVSPARGGSTSSSTGASGRGSGGRSGSGRLSRGVSTGLEFRAETGRTW